MGRKLQNFNVMSEITENGILTDKGREQMQSDAYSMHESDWYKKYPIGDYYEYKQNYQLKRFGKIM
jgi:hypothetical protein